MKTKFTILEKITEQLFALTAFVAFSLIAVLGVGQTTDTYSTAGTHYWTCPDGVTSITVECWGAGGGGGIKSGSGGGGGGGGAYAKTTGITVTPGNTYTIVVGPGGAADVAAGGGIKTTFNGTTVIADYGKGASNETGAVGGTTANSTGTTKYAGGNGGAGNTTGDVGGGGGGCAGPLGNGNSGLNGASNVGGNGGSGNAGNGGAGGAGGNGTAGGAGDSHSTGGGGGGGGDNGKAGGAAGAPGAGGGGGETGGGAGADGQVVITYTCPSYTYNSANAGSDQNLATCATSTTLAGNDPDYGIGTWTVVSGTATITSPNDPETTVTGLVPGTTVTLRWTFTNGSCYNDYDEMTITTNEGAGCWNYCASTFSDNTDFITNVTFSSINNSSGANSGYGNYTNLTPANVLRGSNYTLSVSVQDNSGTYLHQVQAWFDLNNDGDFSDADEYYDLGSQSVGGSPVIFTTNITIPAGATLGNTRMRITEDSDTGDVDDCGSWTFGETEDYTINIVSTPIFTTNPTNQNICYNSSADFTVSANGTEPFTYQWQYQGTNVSNGTPAGAVYSGANTPTLSVSGTMTNATYSAYTCVVSNAYGSSTSSEADLIISSDVAPDPPTNLTKSDDMICSGESVTLGGTVSSGVLEWYTGTCSGTSVTSPVSPTETTTYYAKAYDSGTGCYSACSEITVNVMDEIIFIEEPEDQYGCAGESLTFSVVATGAGLTYQWQEDDGSGFTNITDGGVYSGATSMHLVISDVSGLDDYDYQCVVTGTCDTQTSASATLNEISSGLSGTKTVGSGGDYTTLKAAFDAINTYGLSGNTYLKVISDITETAEASLNEWVDCAGNSGYTVTIYPTGATRTISGNIATSLVTLNGADKVTIDGRIDMTGTANSLVFSNSNTSGGTLKFVNDACDNVIQYATFKGVFTNFENGVIFFSTGVTTGNDRNQILFCDVRDGSSTPTHGIFSGGSLNAKNSENLISDCNIYNFYNITTSNSGIILYENNHAWTIQNNSIYQTVRRPDWSHYGIYIYDESSNDFKIINNFIGGSASDGSGTYEIYPIGTEEGYNNSFSGIYLVCSNTGVSLIKGNTIKNIKMTTFPSAQSPYTSQTNFYGILAVGRVDVIENTIGDNSSTGSIDLTINDNSTYSAWIIGVYKDGDGIISKNKIGSFSVRGTINDQCGFNAIQATGDLINDVIISGNVIGSTTVANSIQTTNAATPAVTFGGIYFGTDGDYKTTVNNNTISNVNIGCTSTMPFFIGLNNQATGGDQIITGNEISNISTASTSTGFFNTPTDFPAFVGIRTNNIAAGANLSINNNHIYNISSTSTSAAVTLFGVYCATGTSGTHLINGNNIHSFSTQNTSYLVWQEGLVLESGTATISNNMIRLGVEGIANDNFIAGIEMLSNSANSVLFNSIYIGGTAIISGTQSTFAYYRSGTGTTDIRNNIFVNARTGGSGIPYAYYLSGITNLTSNYNIYSNNAGGVNAYAGALRTSLAQIQTGTGQDANSMVTNPLYVAPTGTGTACDLHIQTTSPAIGAAVAGTGITTDIDNQTRDDPPCIGADEYVTAPYGTDVYGIYSPDGINGTIEDVEIVSEGGHPGGIGYNVANPDEVYWPNVYISDYHVITASNIMCTNSEFTFTTADASPDWLFGNGAVPSSANTTPSSSHYESTGYKDIIESVKVFSDFNNITLESPDPGVILGAPSGAGCPTTYTYTSSEEGSAGYLYEWNATAPSGCQYSIDNASASTTDITFLNQTGVDQIFLVTLNIETECCGKLKPVERYITIYPGPKMPEIDGGPFSTCEGGTQEVSLLNPDPEYSYEWFDSETGGTQLGSGTSFSFTNIPEGNTSYWVQSTNSFGCSSQRAEIVIEGITPAAPSVGDQSTCGTSDVTFYINSPHAGYIYKWYTGSCGGTLLQSSTSSSFTYNVTATETFYVSAVPPGCAEGNCAEPAVSYLTPTDPILWQGDDATEPKNWFVAENWQNGCLPNCGTNVKIATGLSNYPEIGYHLGQAAAAKNMELVNGASLTFTDNKAQLELCGNFIHNGSLVTNNFGSVSFIGSTAQQYIKSGTATGEFNNVRINNSATNPTVTLTNGDMMISENGTIVFINGTIVTGDNKLIIKNTSSNAIGGFNADRYVIGNLRRYISTSVTDYAFPVGVSDRYALVNLKNNSLTGVTYLDAKFLTSVENNGTLDPTKACDGPITYDYIVTDGTWQIDADANPSGGSYDIALWFNNALTVTGLIDNQFAPLKRPNNSTDAADWAAGGTAIPHAVADGHAERKDWTSFSQYGVGYKETPLPIELLTFDAKYENNVVNINWETASEINNDYFIVQKSKDAINFTNIDKINSLAPNGNSNTLLKYLSVDKDVDYGIFYYRLKQYDIDGTYTYSNVVYVVITQNGAFSIYPNPAKDIIKISYYCNNNDQPIVKLYDERGSLVLTQKIECTKGANNTNIDISKIAPSIYTLIFITKDSLNRVQLIKQ